MHPNVPFSNGCRYLNSAKRILISKANSKY